MSSDRFWNLWWRVLSRQPALWLFAALSQVPVMLLSLFSALLLTFLPTPAVLTMGREGWWSAHQTQLVGMNLVLVVLALVGALLASLVSLWAEAGLMTVVRRVWERPDQPLAMREALRGTLAPFGRLLLLSVALIALVLVLALAWGLAVILLSGSGGAGEEILFLVVFGSLCLLFPVALAVAPWIQALRVAVVVEEPARLREIWQGFLTVARRGWLGLYGMLILSLAVALAFGLVRGAFNLPVSLMLGSTDNPSFVMIGPFLGGLLIAVVNIPQVAILSSGWAALYLHYRYPAAEGSGPASAWGTSAAPATPETGPENTRWDEARA